LRLYDSPEATPEYIAAEVEKQLNFHMPPSFHSSQTSSSDSDSSEWADENHFKWQPTTGPSGWWTFLLKGIWVSGAKVLRNQPALLDVQSPFVHAPSRDAVERFYAAIPGSFRLTEGDGDGDGRFFAVPCLGQRDVEVVFELGGWNFPVMKGGETRAEALHAPLGGWGTLGMVGKGSGFCVGVVVESRIGEGERLRESGLKGSWVLGEPFFRGMGVVFDADLKNGGKEMRVGFRAY
jgi:hypothetical protein